MFTNVRTPPNTVLGGYPAIKINVNHLIELPMLEDVVAICTI